MKTATKPHSDSAWKHMICGRHDQPCAWSGRTARHA